MKHLKLPILVSQLEVHHNPTGAWEEAPRPLKRPKLPTRVSWQVPHSLMEDRDQPRGRLTECPLLEEPTKKGTGVASTPQATPAWFECRLPMLKPRG